MPFKIEYDPVHGKIENIDQYSRAKEYAKKSLIVGIVLGILGTLSLGFSFYNFLGRHLTTITAAEMIGGMVFDITAAALIIFAIKMIGRLQDFNNDIQKKNLITSNYH